MTFWFFFVRIVIFQLQHTQFSAQLEHWAEKSVRKTFAEKSKSGRILQKSPMKKVRVFWIGPSNSILGVNQLSRFLTKFSKGKVKMSKMSRNMRISIDVVVGIENQSDPINFRVSLLDFEFQLEQPRNYCRQRKLINFKWTVLPRPLGFVVLLS